MLQSWAISLFAHNNRGKQKTQKFLTLQIVICNLNQKVHSRSNKTREIAHHPKSVFNQIE